MVTANLKSYNDDELIALIDNMNNGRLVYSLQDLKMLQAEANNRRLPTQYPGIIADLLRRALQSDTKPVETNFSETAEALNPQSVKDIKNILDSMPKVDFNEKSEDEEFNYNYEKKIKKSPVKEIKREEKEEISEKEKIRKEQFKTLKEEEYVPPETKKKKKIDYSEEIIEDYYEDRFPVLNFLVGFNKLLGWFAVILTFIAFGYFATITFQKDIMMVIIAFFGTIIISALELLLFYSFSESIKLKLEIERHLSK